MKQNVFLRLKNIHKIYPNGVHAVHDFNLEIKPQEFIVFVGPSGCGKSTTLRMIAGLEDITEGDLYIDQRLANNLSPKERDIAMVFQSYALYPHMNVYNNLAFGLRMRKIRENVLDTNGVEVKAIDEKKIAKLKKDISYINKDIVAVAKSLSKAENIIDVEKKEKVVEKLQLLHFSLAEEKTKKEQDLAYYNATPIPVQSSRRYRKQEIDEKVRKAAEVLDIEQYLFSRPRELSGGQRQRVALGRSIVRNAKLFLMDEPLSNLDAKLRISMRSEIVALHRALKATTVYVTHDQIEAMTMADRIVVMKDGFIQQIGTPLEIYHQPVNVFVATFMGSPAMNIFKADYQNGLVNINATKIKVGKDIQTKIVKFNETQIERLSNENQNLTRYIDAHRIALEHEKNSFQVKKIMRKIKDNVATREQNNKLIGQYKEFLLKEKHQLVMGVRPENIIVSKTETEKAIKANVTFVELLGKEYYVHLVFNDEKVIASVAPKLHFEIGDDVYIDFENSALNTFDSISELRIC